MVDDNGRRESASDSARAAFVIQVEVSTRVGLQPLGRSQGLLSEALASLYALFGTVRGAVEAWNRDGGADDRALRIADELLEEVLRPFLDRWYPRMAALEDSAAPGQSLAELEAGWEHAGEFRRELDALSEPLARINRQLAEVTGADLEPRLPMEGSTQGE